METTLSVTEVAELEGISSRAIRKRISQDTLKAKSIPSSISSTGYEYRIRLSELSPQAQVKYYSQIQEHIPAPAPPKASAHEQKAPERELDELTDQQREQVAHWKRVIESWQSFIAEYPKQRTAKTDEFLEQYNILHPTRQISARTLWLKWKKYREFGEAALADGRVDRPDKGTSTIPEVAWSVFCQWWLDEARPTVKHCYHLLQSWVRQGNADVDLPGLGCFYREANKIPTPVLKYFRYGKKKLEDEAMPFVQRMYDAINSNDVWVADYHTLDMFVRDDHTQRVFRPHVVAWLDVRSRKILAITLCESSNSDGVISAFRKAAKGFGLPRGVYLDNGREFLVSDFGGRGKRKTASNASYGETMLQRMGIEMVNAKVANAKAKIIERAFRTFTEQFSKLVATYTGGSPEQKPERLERMLKEGEEIPLRSKVESGLWTYIEGWYNTRTSDAEGVNGLTRNEAYAKYLIKKRVATEAELRLMTLRTARLQSVDRNGVYLKFAGSKVWFYNTDLIMHHAEQKVFVRYDPDNLSSVRIEDEDGRFLMEAYLKDAGGYGGDVDKEAIKRNEQSKRKLRDDIKNYKSKLTDLVVAPSAMEVLMREAEHNIESEASRTYDAPVLEPVRLEAHRQLRAVGYEEPADVIFDMQRMLENARQQRKGDGKGD